jgi:hypothetical protein
MKKIIVILGLLLLSFSNSIGQIPVNLKSLQGDIIFTPYDNIEHPNIKSIAIDDSSLYIKYYNSNYWFKYRLGSSTDFGKEILCIIYDKENLEGIFSFSSTNEVWLPPKIGQVVKIGKQVIT